MATAMKLRDNPLLITPSAPHSELSYAGVKTYRLKLDETDPAIAMHIPDPDPTWHITPFMTQLVMALDANMNVLLSGDAGCGKTTMVYEMCAQRRWPCTRLNMTTDKDEDKLFGRWIVAGKEMKWVDGVVTQAVSSGHVLLMDEYDFADPRILASMRGLMEPQFRQLRLDAKDGQLVRPHPMFRVVATANSIGNENRLNYTGHNLMNLADLDRFGWTMYIEHFKPDVEVPLLLRKVPGLPQEIGKNMVTVANMVREANEKQQCTYPFGFRSLVDWGKGYMMHRDPGLALQCSCLNVLDPAEHLFVRGIAEKLFGTGDDL